MCPFYELQSLLSICVVICGHVFFIFFIDFLSFISYNYNVFMRKSVREIVLFSDNSQNLTSTTRDKYEYT